MRQQRSDRHPPHANTTLVVQAEPPPTGEIDPESFHQGLCGKPLPQEGEWVNLTVTPGLGVLEVVTRARYPLMGLGLPGPTTSGESVSSPVTLVRLGRFLNVRQAAGRAYDKGYQLVAGQGIESFLDMFPLPDGCGPVVFGGSRWQARSGLSFVAVLHGFDGLWVPKIKAADSPCGSVWRWAVTPLPKVPP